MRATILFGGGCLDLRFQLLAVLPVVLEDEHPILENRSGIVVLSELLDVVEEAVDRPDNGLLFGPQRLHN